METQTQPEKLVFDRRAACEVAFGDSPDFDVVRDEIVDHSRWTVAHTVVVRRKSDQKLFISHYSVGATESQDQSPYEYDEPEFYEAREVTKTVSDYEVVA